MKINLRTRLPGGTTSVDWIDLPEVPAVGDVVVDTKAVRWEVVDRTWVAPTKGVVLEILLYVRGARRA